MIETRRPQLTDKLTIARIDKSDPMIDELRAPYLVPGVPYYANPKAVWYGVFTSSEMVGCFALVTDYKIERHELTDFYVKKGPLGVAAAFLIIEAVENSKWPVLGVLPPYNQKLFTRLTKRGHQWLGVVMQWPGTNALNNVAKEDAFI